MTSLADLAGRGGPAGHGGPAGRGSQTAADAERAAIAAGRAARDPRLDVFRGLAMLIIFTAHMPGNLFTLWIPARWGFSDATEIFVFCSGTASALAFGRSFDRAGWAMGTARVGHRVWQVYWSHIGMFFAIATMLAAIDLSGWLPDKTYIGTLNLWRFFADPGPQLVGLMTLTYVPNYFDILPMYLAILAMMPAMVALSRVSPWLPVAASLVVWTLAQGRVLDAVGLGGLHLSLPAEPWSDRRWFFNPFAWQLVFFTGFALIRGWLPAPPVSRALVLAAGAILVLSVLPSSIGVRVLGLDWAREWREEWRWAITKTDFGVLRYVHFLALAYLCWAAAGEGGRRLFAGAGAARRAGLAMITKVGQQSLAVFVTSMLLARLFGAALDAVGRSGATVTAANLGGWALLVATAYLVGWFKAAPWRVR